MPDSTVVDKIKLILKVRFAIGLGIVLLVLFITIALIQPAMPKKIFLFTGSKTSAYHEMGVRLAEDLKRQGIDVEVVTTKGALDNVRRLQPDTNAVAFAPATDDWVDADGVASKHLVALGSIGYEPHWLFYRSELPISKISDLAGHRVATEDRGTTSRHIASLLIDRNGLSGQVELFVSDMNPTALVQGFKDKTLDAVFVSGNPHTPVIEALLGLDGVSFLSVHRAEAYSLLFPGVTTLRAPQGVFNLQKNIPTQDASLLANTTCLIAHDSLHPAIIPMILSAAENAQHRRSQFSTVSFPNSEQLPLPLAPASRRYFHQGEVGPLKYFPYRVTRFLNHLGFFVLPLLAATLLLLKSVSLGTRTWGKMKLNRFFKRLEAVEKAQNHGEDGKDQIAELDQIDRASSAMFVPLSLVHDYIDFRQFLHDMRERVDKR